MLGRVVLAASAKAPGALTTVFARPPIWALAPLSSPACACCSWKSSALLTSLGFRLGELVLQLGLDRRRGGGDGGRAGGVEQGRGLLRQVGGPVHVVVLQADIAGIEARAEGGQAVADPALLLGVEGLGDRSGQGVGVGAGGGVGDGAGALAPPPPAPRPAPQGSAKGRRPPGRPAPAPSGTAAADKAGRGRVAGRHAGLVVRLVGRLGPSARSLASPPASSPGRLGPDRRQLGGAVHVRHALGLAGRPVEPGRSGRPRWSGWRARRARSSGSWSGSAPSQPIPIIAYAMAAAQGAEGVELLGRTGFDFHQPRRRGSIRPRSPRLTRSLTFWALASSWPW